MPLICHLFQIEGTMIEAKINQPILNSERLLGWYAAGERLLLSPRASASTMLKPKRPARPLHNTPSS